MRTSVNEVANGLCDKAIKNGLNMHGGVVVFVKAQAATGKPRISTKSPSGRGKQQACLVGTKNFGEKVG